VVLQALSQARAGLGFRPPPGGPPKPLTADGIFEDSAVRVFFSFFFGFVFFFWALFLARDESSQFRWSRGATIPRLLSRFPTSAQSTGLGFPNPASLFALGGPWPVKQRGVLPFVPIYFSPPLFFL